MKQIFGMRRLEFFLNEGIIDKITWIKSKPIKSFVKSDKLKELTKLATHTFYDVLYLSDKKEINKDKPILVYFGNNKDGINFLDKQNIPKHLIYNNPNEAGKSSNKLEWHEMLNDKPYIPKTVTNKSKIKELKFPIIAKPSNGHSGIGIMKFDTLEECLKHTNRKDCELDVFSEVVNDIDTEFRFIFLKDKLFIVHERIPIKNENKTIDTKKPSESLQFLYVQQDNIDFYRDKVKDIVQDFRKYIKLDFFALDILQDNKGKLWVIESNSGIGMGANTMSLTYKEICEDFYNMEISDEKSKMVDKICKEYYDEILSLYPEEIKSSKKPKKY